RRMLELSPNQIEGLFYLGGAYLKQGNEENAIEQWQKAIQTDPGSFPAIYALGAVLAGRRQYGEAREWLTRACILRPDHAFTRFELGRIAYHEKRYAEAESQLREAIKLAPELREASCLLANTYRQLGKIEDARREALRSARLYRLALQ